MVGVGAFQEVFDAGRQHSRDIKVVFAEDSCSNIPKLFGNVAGGRLGVSEQVPINNANTCVHLPL
jgi:hypothetical protein